MKIKSKRVFKMMVCLLVAICVLACSFSVLAVDPTPVPTIDPGLVYDPLMELNYRAAMQIIYNMMQAWGIDVEYKGYKEFGDEIEGLLLTWVTEFLDSLPSQYEIATWIAPWQAGYDYWGNSRYNESALEDIQEFVDWLTAKLGLSDNSTVVINPVYSLGGYNLYNVNQYYSTNQSGQDRGYINIKVGNATRNVYYFVAHITSGTIKGWRYVLVSDSAEANINVNQYAIYQNGDELAVSQTGNISLRNNYGGDTLQYIYANINVGIWPDSNNPVYPSGGSYFEGGYWDLGGFLRTAQITQEGDTKVITSTISMPDDNPNYSPGDGITIINGEPEYGVIEFPDSISVNNLPAVIQPQKVENPEIDQFYDFIPSFINEAGDSINFFKQIIFRMPDEVLYCIYAVLASGVIFGFLRILREH